MYDVNEPSQSAPLLLWKKVTWFGVLFVFSWLVDFIKYRDSYDRKIQTRVHLRKRKSAIYM